MGPDVTIILRVAVLIAVVLMGYQLTVTPNQFLAAAAYMDARAQLELDDPDAALAMMRAAAVLNPFDPDYRRNLMTPIARLAQRGEIVADDLAIRSYVTARIANGADQNTLSHWLIWLVITGRGGSEAYALAREEIERVNPNLAEPYITDAMVFFDFGRPDLSLEAIAEFEKRAITDAQRERAAKMREIITEKTNATN